MKSIIKMMTVVIMLTTAITEVSAQGFFKKITKAITDTTPKTETLTPENSEENAKRDSILKTPLKFEVKKVIEFNAEGDTIKNEDGTVKVSYRVVDENDKIYDPAVVQQMVNVRLKAYGKILAKVGGGAALGAVKGLLSKNKKEALTGAAVGAAAGLAFSAKDIKEIRGINKDLKQLKTVLEAYQTTFTEEGLPKMADADLSNVNGIDFTQCTETTKLMAEVQSDLEESKNMDIPSLDELSL